jgi:hypothetical protein
MNKNSNKLNKGFASPNNSNTADSFILAHKSIGKFPAIV